MMFDPEKITYFAKTDARGSLIPFGIKAKDRQRHMYVIGKTGMGKSTLLENLAAQDIMNGEGVAFIDPHGSAAETLLEYVPEHRINDVVYFAPFDMSNPVAFNVMEDVGEDKRHLVVSGLMSTFKKIWVDAWSARMEYILTNTLLALIEYPDTTLLSVNRMLADKAYRSRVVDYIKDPAVKAYWTDEFANYTERFAAEALPAIQNKVGQFTGNPLIRNIIGQPHSSFDIRKMMDEKKILIMNLSKGLIGETNANLLGSMLTTRIYLAAMSRADLRPDIMKQMPNFYFYVDEFQSFANSTFANILSEARKYHLNLIIAHQYIAQMEEEVRDAVFGNVGTTVTFRVGPFDAEVLETVFTPTFLAADLVNLGFAQIYLTLMIDGVGSQPFSAQTLGPLTRPPISYRDVVIAASRKNYGQAREAVEKIIVDMHAPLPPKEGDAKKPVVKKPAPFQTGQKDSGKGGNNGGGGNNSNNNNGNSSGARNNFNQNGNSNSHGNRNGNENGKSANSGTNEKNQPKPPRRDEVSENKKAESGPKETARPAAIKQADDLRAILSKLSQAQASAPAPGKEVVPEPASPAREDLKSALAAVLPKAAEHTPAAPAPASAKPEPAPAPASTPAPMPAPRPVVTDTIPTTQTSPTPPTPLPTTPAVASSPTSPTTSPAVQPRRVTPPFGAGSNPNLDPAVIKKMLRDEKNDRSPFS